jgi:hypothetical protein
MYFIVQLKLLFMFGNLILLLFFKLILYYFRLIEKIYVVSASRKGRWNTLSYKLHISLLFPYIGIFILMVTKTVHLSLTQDLFIIRLRFI